MNIVVNGKDQCLLKKLHNLDSCTVKLEVKGSKIKQSEAEALFCVELHFK